jgi:protein-S-isoprenylcysteine O-methyltransferase
MHCTSRSFTKRGLSKHHNVIFSTFHFPLTVMTSHSDDIMDASSILDTSTLKPNTATGRTNLSIHHHLFQDSFEYSESLLDGKHSPQNVAFYSFGLGMTFILGFQLAFSYYLPSALGIYISALSLFHFLEYFSTALWNGRKVKLSSFLLDHSTAYHTANAAGIIECLVEWLLTPELKQFGWWTVLGALMVIIGQTARTLAMATAGASFNHMVQSQREHQQTLITHGIYGWMRHPSYFGFYMWAVGTQIMVANPFSLVAFTIILHRFFSERIIFEEKTLLRFFGKEYADYKRRVGTMMPFIRGC